MGASTDKRAIVERVRAVLAKEIEVLRASAASAREGATHDEAKPEDDKDTRAIEASYLAGAQAGRIRVLEAADKKLEFMELREMSAAGPGALVVLDVDGKTSHFFLAEAAGGTKVRVDGTEITVLTPEAPLAQSLIGKKAGDSFERVVRGEPVEYEILSVR